MELIRKVLISFELSKDHTCLTISKMKYNLKRIIKKYKNFQKLKSIKFLKL